MDNNGVLYVADTGNSLIQKFSDNGEFISQFCVNNNDNKCTTVDMALDQDNGLIYCAEIGHKCYDFYRRNKMLVFNLRGELQHSYNLKNTTWPNFIAINRNDDMIISDHTNGCLCKFSKQGKYLGCMGEFIFQAFITVRDDDSIIVAYRDAGNVCIINTDGTRHKFGNVGTGKGQLVRPYGTATNGDNILVADSGNNRIHVFTCDCTFVSMIESEDDILNFPVGLVVTQDGYVYVVDQGHNCIKKYKDR